MSKQKLIQELTRLDTACFRKSGLIDEGKYRHEPPLFRPRLAKIYDSLSAQEIQELINIKQGKPIEYVKNNSSNIADWINYWDSFSLELYLKILQAKKRK